MIGKVAMSCLAVAMLITVANGYSKGAPAEVCDDMTPQHPGTPMKTPAPYSVTVSKRNINPEQFVFVTISGKNANKFKGFLVQGRVGDEPVGSFEQDQNINLVDCGNGRQNAATHINSNDKQKVTLKWKAPRGLSEIVHFNATIAQDGAVYWVGLNSPRVTVGKPVTNGRQ